MPLISDPHAGFASRETVPATLEAIERLCATLRRRCARLISEPDCFSAELLLREAMTNAVLHGSGNNPERRIRIATRVRGHSLMIAVEDEGPGFDWRTAQVRRAALDASSGRGLEIFSKYASRVRFSDRGNAVVLRKSFTRRATSARDELSNQGVGE